MAPSKTRRPSSNGLKYFTDLDVHHLKQYKYKSIDKSFIANNILNPYWWTPLVQVFPTWVAPNVITLSGFLFVVVNLITLLIYAPTLTETVPSWAYFSFALGLFLYQSFDAIDGKQARRTGTSGPLGELFDHGCDALNTGLGSIVGATALGVGPSGWLVFTLMSTLSNFYLSTWEEYHTGTLYLSYCSGPVEGLLSVCFVFIVTGVFGNQIWNTPIREAVAPNVTQLLGSLADLQLNHAFIYFALIVVLFNVISSGYNVVVARLERRETLLPPFLGIIPIFVFIAAASLWAFQSPSIIPHHIVPFAITLTFLQGHHVGSIIVAHVAKRPFPFLHTPSWVVLAAAAGATAWLRRLGDDGAKVVVEWLGGNWVVERFGGIKGVEGVPREVVALEGVMVVGLMGVTFWMYAGLVRTVVWELCEVFGIHCLKVGKSKKGGEEVRLKNGEDGPISKRTRGSKRK